ncbi:hypothetical protein L0244_00200 [bacterium]|nr:hypothetical protein [bacterium]
MLLRFRFTLLISVLYISSNGAAQSNDPILLKAEQKLHEADELLAQAKWRNLLLFILSH